MTLLVLLILILLRLPGESWSIFVFGFQSGYTFGREGFRAGRGKRKICKTAGLGTILTTYAR